MRNLMRTERAYLRVRFHFRPAAARALVKAPKRRMAAPYKAGSSWRTAEPESFLPARCKAFRERITSSGVQEWRWRTAAGLILAAQGFVVRTEMADGGGVKPRVIALHRTAVQRLAGAGQGLQTGDDGLGVPVSIPADLIDVQSGRFEGGVPTAEKTGLESGERRPAQFVAAVGDGRPVQVFAAAAGLLDELDDALARPAWAADDFAVIDPRLLDGATVGAEVIGRGRNQRLQAAAHGVVGDVFAGAVQLAKLLKDADFVPDHSEVYFTVSAVITQ